MKIKELPTLTSIALCSAFMLTGCVGLHVGGGPKTTTIQPTVGQQLVDLKKARDAGALTEDEYQSKRAKLAGN